MAQPFLWCATHGLLLLAPRTRVCDFDVVNAVGGAIDAPLASLQAALALIRDRAPGRFARLARDVSRFVIIGAGGPEYWPYADGIALTPAVLTGLSVEEVSLVLIHEATHAHIWRFGIRYWPSVRERIERACVRAEVGFAERLPKPEEWVAYVQSKLANPWWTTERIRVRRADARSQL